MTATTGHRGWQTVTGRLPDRRTTLCGRFVAIATLMLAAVLLSSCGIFQSNTSSSTDILQQNVPGDWTLMTDPALVNGFQDISIDGDADTEYLLFYRYDAAPDTDSGPIGGIIYDGQQDTSIYDPDTSIPIPLQPLAFFVPYRLLPDWTTGKGQGYLGDLSITWETTPASETDVDFAPELVIIGSNASGQNRLSLFRWLGVTGGYGVSYFQGSYSVTMPDWTPSTSQRIDKVITLDAFTDRSKLCKRTEWTRQGSSAQFTPTPQTVVFCLGAIPEQPTYPEAVVLAWLMTGDAKYATSQEAQDQLRLAVPGNPQQIVSLIYPGAADISGTGNETRSQMVVEFDLRFGWRSTDGPLAPAGTDGYRRERNHALAHRFCGVTSSYLSREHSWIS